MNPESFDAETYVDAATRLLGLMLTAESRAEAIFNLRVAAVQAELLLSVDFDELEEPAPVFRA